MCSCYNTDNDLYLLPQLTASNAMLYSYSSVYSVAGVFMLDTVYFAYIADILGKDPMLCYAMLCSFVRAYIAHRASDAVYTASIACAADS